jgi:hypothetical protein
MASKNMRLERITLAIVLADGHVLPVEMGANSARFIGRFSRVAAFGPLGTMLRITALPQG